MFVTRLDIEGLRHAEHRTVESPDRTVSVGHGADSGALLDALDLFAAALAPTDLAAVARRLGWDAPSTETVGDTEVELAGLATSQVAAALAPGARSVTVEGVIALDPPLYGRLREHAVRDPRMVTALGQEPSVVIKVGWLFNRDRSGAKPTVLAFRIGNVGFDTSGKERPAWLVELCAEIGTRFARTDMEVDGDTLAERLLAAWLAPEVVARVGYTRLVQAVAQPPFSLPEMGLVRHGGRLAIVFGPDLVPARQLGRPALDAIRLCEALFLRRPDVLAVEQPVAPGVAEWLATVVEGSHSPVEQVWIR